MARSFSNAKIFSAFSVDRVYIALSRRRYATASLGVASASHGGMGKKSGEESAKKSWVPDPVTGYYRPENRADEIDVAELREMLLKNKIRQN